MKAFVHFSTYMTPLLTMAIEPMLFNYPSQVVFSLIFQYFFNLLAHELVRKTEKIEKGFYYSVMTEGIAKESTNQLSRPKESQ